MFPAIFSDALIQPCKVELKRIKIDSDIPLHGKNGAVEGLNLIQPHECKRCTAHFDNELELKTHMLSKCLKEKSDSQQKSASKYSLSHGSKRKEYKCTVCGKTFNCGGNFIRHMKKLHKMIVRCKHVLCSSYFLNEAERQKHHEQVHVGGKEMECIYCGKFLTGVFSLRHHMRRRHTKEAIQCDFNRRCAKFFLTKTEKDEHIHQVHNSRPTVQCVYCGKICRDKGVLRPHMTHFHADVSIRCSYSGCGLFFLSQIESQEHFRLEHTVQVSLKKFQCLKCTFKTTDKHLLLNHVELTHFKDKINCRECQRIFWSRKSLHRHMNYAHSEPITCEHCGKEMNKFSLRTHARQFLCKWCNKEVPCVYLLHNHSKICSKKNKKAKKIFSNKNPLP